MLGLKNVILQYCSKKIKTNMFFIKELSLIHTSTSLAKGYKDIENKSNEIINNLKINNLESHIQNHQLILVLSIKNKNIFC